MQDNTNNPRGQTGAMLAYARVVLGLKLLGLVLLIPRLVSVIEHIRSVRITSRNRWSAGVSMTLGDIDDKTGITAAIDRFIRFAEQRDAVDSR